MKQTTQNYLKTIFSLCYPHRESVKVSEVSKKLDISSAAVTEMVKKLSAEGFVASRPYKGIRLTPKGMQVGRNMIRHHRLWESYLFTVLGMPWDKVHEEAERLEHACSDYLINKLEEALGYPQLDPHGNPIPDRHGNIPEVEKDFPLTACEPGDQVLVTRVVDLDEQYLNYLDQCGIALQSRMKLQEVLSFDQSIVCRVGQRAVTLSQQAAQHIYVKKE